MPSKSEPQVTVDGSEGNANMVKSEMGDRPVHIKEEVLESQNEKDTDDDYQYEERETEDASYPIDLPLEVITTIEPFNYAYPYLKNMSNGVLTHRNIFTEREREVLKKIVDKYRDIVDTRSRTREIYMEKQSVWQQIVDEYNSTENILVRSEKELKKCWDNMKYRAKQAEKEQQRVEHDIAENKAQDPHQIACNAVQAALEKMMAIQTNGGSGEEPTNGFKERENGDFNEDTKENWDTSGAATFDIDSRYSANGDDLKELEKNEDDLYDDDDDDDDQPVLKKARQESPKLSSILLGDAKKGSSLMTSRSHYSIPNCTKITHIKKKTKKSSNTSSPVSILPKGLPNSCVSIMNIPNPNNVSGNALGTSSSIVTSNGSSDLHSAGAISLGGGITISPQRSGTTLSSSLSAVDSSSQLKPLPYLKKMMPGKGSKKGLRTPFNRILPYSTYEASSPTMDQEETSEGDTERSLLEEKLLLQRLELGRQEHTLRMKVLEKQLQAYTNEAQFWALRTKLLRRGQEEGVGKMMNGDV